MSSVASSSTINRACNPVTGVVIVLNLLLGLGCVSDSPVSPGGSGGRTSLRSGVFDPGTRLPNGEAVAARLEVRLDPATLSVEVSPLRAASAQPPQGHTYDLDIEQFLTAESFRVVGARLTEEGDFALDFTHAHPFPAPDFLQPITSLNRADLGYTGRLLILVDGSPSSYFAGEVQVVDDAVRDADGYLDTGDLLATTGLGLNTFPYVLLADEAEDNRLEQSNGGAMQGNYDPLAGGWQRSNAGSTGAGWIGYDFLHGGQTIENTFSLSAPALAGTGFRFSVALLIKYTDPRGAGGKALRFPPESVDVLQFAYRLPYAALDISKVQLQEAVEVEDTPAGDSAPIGLRIRDWDAMAPAGPDATVGDDPDITRIQLGAGGAPVVALDSPALMTAPILLTVAPGGSGRPFEEKIATGVVTNERGTATPGLVPACIRVIDPEDNDLNAGTYRFGVDPFTIAADPGRALRVRTCQIVPIHVRSTAIPPVVTSVSPVGIIGQAGAQIDFSAVAQNNPTGWIWNFGPGASPATSTLATPQVTLASPGSYVGSVIASNGAGDSPLFQFAYTVEPLAPPFAMHTITTSGAAGTSADVVLHQGKPAISFYVSSTADLYIALAEVTDPVAASDWLVYALDTPGDAGKDTSLAVHDGRLAVSYYDETNGDLKLAMANVPNPLSVADWTLQIVDQLLDAGDESSLVSLSTGRLAVAYHGETAAALKFALAKVPTPSSPDDWTVTVLDLQDNAGGDKSMLEFNGRLAISYEAIASDDLRFALSANLQPASVSDWALHPVDTEGVVGEASSLAAFNNRLAIAYDYDTGDNLRFARARVEFPASATDWDLHDPDSVGNTGERTSLVYADGRPAVVYFDNSNADLRFARAKVAEPSSEADWQLLTLNPGNVGRENTGLLVMPDATFAVVYQADGNLTFGRAAFPW